MHPNTNSSCKPRLERAGDDEDEDEGENEDEDEDGQEAVDLGSAGGGGGGVPARGERAPRRRARGRS